MCFLRCQLCHPERIFNPHENCSRKWRKSYKIRMPNSQLWFSNWKTRGACGARALGPPQPSKKDLWQRMVLYWFPQIHLCDHCGRNFVDETKLTNHMSSHSKNGKIKKVSGSNYDCPHCPRYYVYVFAISKLKFLSLIKPFAWSRNRQFRQILIIIVDQTIAIMGKLQWEVYNLHPI